MAGSRASRDTTLTAIRCRLHHPFSIPLETVPTPATARTVVAEAAEACPQAEEEEEEALSRRAVEAARRRLLVLQAVLRLRSRSSQPAFRAATPASSSERLPSSGASLALLTSRTARPYRAVVLDDA